MKLSFPIGFGVLLLAAVMGSAEGSDRPNLRHEEEPHGAFQPRKSPVDLDAIPKPAHAQGAVKDHRMLQDFCDPFTDPDCDCMGDVAITTGLLKQSPLDFGCTSNDVRVAETTVLSVDGVTEGPFTCIEGDLIEVQLAVAFENGASSRRSDIGLWLSQDGGDAESGDCKFSYFPTPDPGDLDNADEPPDTCGDLQAKEMVPDILLETFTLTCSDEGGVMGGLVNIGSCIGWKVPGADENCDAVADDPPGPAEGPDNYAAATLPANKSKCRCEILVLDITILSPPSITKSCDSVTLSQDQESVVYGFTVGITNPNPDNITPWSVVDTPIEFDDPLNSDNDGALLPNVNTFNPAITRSVPDAFFVDTPFSDTVTLSTNDYDDVTATATCPPFVFDPAALTANITCDDQGTSAVGTDFIVTQTFSGEVCNTGGTKAKNVVVTVVDGNDNILYNPDSFGLAAGACDDFANLPGTVTAGFTGTCDATFSATVTATGEDIAGRSLSASATADCPVCDCT